MNYDIRVLFSPRLCSQESHINFKREDKAETKANSNQNLHDSSFTNALVIIYGTFLDLDKILDCGQFSASAAESNNRVVYPNIMSANMTNVSTRRVSIIFASINSLVLSFY